MQKNAHMIYCTYTNVELHYCVQVLYEYGVSMCVCITFNVFLIQLMYSSFVTQFRKICFWIFSFGEIAFAGKHKAKTHFTFDYPFSYRKFSYILCGQQRYAKEETNIVHNKKFYGQKRNHTKRSQLISFWHKENIHTNYACACCLCE